MPARIEKGYAGSENPSNLKVVGLDSEPQGELCTETGHPLFGSKDGGRSWQRLSTQSVAHKDLKRGRDLPGSSQTHLRSLSGST